MKIDINGTVGIILMIFFGLLSYVDHSVATFLVYSYSIFLIFILGVGILAVGTALFFLVTDPVSVKTGEGSEPKVKKGFMFYMGIAGQGFFWYSIFTNTSVALATVGISTLVLTVILAVAAIILAKELLKERKEAVDILSEKE